MTNFNAVMNVKKFLKDAEEVCFDCGSSESQLTIIHEGVALCPLCLKTAMDDYRRK